MFTDSEGRYITAGQWHDEKFFAFTNPPELLADVPPSMILGGMKEEEDQEVAVPATTVPKEIAVKN